MRVAGITKDGDFNFGRGLASYKIKSDAINQNVVTRIRLFTDDWFLDTDNGNPWFDLFGGRAQASKIRRQVEHSVMTTEGVLRINKIEVIEDTKERTMSIILSYIDIFDNEFNESLVIEE